MGSLKSIVPFDSVRSLKEVFAEWGLPDHFHTRMSSRWQCRLVCEQPALPEAEQTFCAAQEAYGNRMLHPSNSKPTVFSASLTHKLKDYMRSDMNDGSSDVVDGLSYFTQDKYNSFASQSQRIAFTTGWAGPDTFMDDDEYSVLVHDVKSVLDHPKVVNLQLFHRDDIAHWPKLIEYLEIPPEVAHILHPTEGAGVVLDSATRISRETALTWWHLDDGGEYVYQCALPLEEAVRGCRLRGPTGAPVVKIFVYAPNDPHVYDLIFHDDECNRTGKCMVLDLFETPTEALPEELPILTIAVLEAGGGPLFSPPNLPHLVITVQDCVMIERRVLSLLNLREVYLFRDKAKGWKTAPIMYSFLTDVLPDREKMQRTVVPRITPYLSHSSLSARKGAQESLMLIGTDHGADILGELVEQELRKLTTPPWDAVGALLSTLGEHPVIFFRGRPIYGTRCEHALKREEQCKLLEKAARASLMHTSPFMRSDLPLWIALRELKNMVLSY